MFSLIHLLNNLNNNFNYNANKKVFLILTIIIKFKNTFKLGFNFRE
jgi:hypothetical protein